jgi:uncharacterized lipoprotein YajG
MSPRLISLAGAALLISCGPSVTTQSNPNIPIPQGATYAWVGTQDVNGGDPVVSNEIVHSMIQNSIQQQMTTKGYKLVTDQAEAKFYVRYYLGTKTETSYVSTTMGGGYGPGYGYGWGYGGMGMTTTQPVETTVGNAIVDLVQMGTNTLVWRGTMTANLSNKAPTQEKVNQSVATIMAGLPSATGAPPSKK